MSVAVPIVHEQDSSLSQVFHSLGLLESVVSDVFASVVARTGAEKEKLSGLNARVRAMGTQIAQIAAHKQYATCVTSPAKLPSVSSQTAPVFTPLTRQQIQAHALSQAAPLPCSTKHAPSAVGDVSELFWALDHSRQSLREAEGSKTNSDKALSSVSSLVPFGSKQLPEPLPPKKTEVVLGPAPMSSSLPAAEKSSLLFPRSRATPPSMNTPTDLPLPKLAWFSPVEVKALLSSSPSIPVPVSEAPPLLEVRTVVPLPVPVTEEQVSPAVLDTQTVPPLLSREEQKVTVRSVDFTQEEKKTVSEVLEVKAPPEPVRRVAPADSHTDLLREIERRGEERARRAAEQASEHQAKEVVVHVAPIPAPTADGALLDLSQSQDEALRRALEQHRRAVEDDDVWEPTDDF